MNPKAAQAIVNAQTEVNRAVWALNEEQPPPPTYILDCIHDAMRDLAVARRILSRRGKRE